MDFHVLEVVCEEGGVILMKKLPFKEETSSGYSSLVAFANDEKVSRVFLPVSECTRFTWQLEIHALATK